MNIDEIDKQILRALIKNGRESLTQIADKIIKSNNEPMSHAGIRKRMSKLENSKFLKIQGNIGIEALNYQAAFILLEMKNFDEIKNIKEAYKDCPRVFLLSQLSGRYNLIMGIIAHNISILQRYLNYCGPSNKDGVLHSEVLFVSGFDAPKFFPINIFCNISQETKCGNTCKECEAFLHNKCGGCGTF
ncbi:MAG: Lrp/AsnC family transcriptional regulator [Promethearchaeota archaeon]